MEYFKENELEKYPPFLDVITAAKLINSTRQHVYNLIRDGKIQCLHVGRKVLIPRDMFLNSIETMNAKKEMISDGKIKNH